jgi:hypothetical protein
MAEPTNNDQGQLHTAINQQLSQTRKLLRDQAVLHETINQTLRNGIESAAGSGAKVDEMLKRQGVALRRSRASQIKDTLETNRAAQAEAGKARQEISASNESFLSQLLTTLDAAGGKAKDFAKQLRDNVDGAHKILDALSGDWQDKANDIQTSVGGTVIGTLDSTNKMSLKLMENLSTNIIRFNSKMVEGTDLSYKQIFKNFGEYYGHIEAISKRGYVSYQIMEGLTAKQLDQAKLLATGLKLEDAELAEILERQVSRTGESNLDMLTEIAVFSKSLSKTTGIASKDIAKQMSGIISDTYRFANVTTEQAARMSASLTNVGLSYSDLSNTVSEFQSLEGAIDKSAKMMTVFGGNINSIEMMNFALDDQGKFLGGLQKWWKSTGRNIRTEGTAAKQLLSSLTGGLAIPKIERLFAPGAGAAEVEDIEKGLAIAKEAANDPKSAIKLLEGDMQRALNVGESLTDEILDNLVGALSANLVPAMGKASIGMKEFAKVAPIKGVQELSKLLKEVAGFTDKDMIKMQDGINGLGDAFLGLFKKLGNYDVTGTMKPFADALSSIAEPLVAAILKQFKALGVDLKPMFLQWGKWMGEGFKLFSIPSSPLPKVQLDILNYFLKMSKMSVEGFNKEFDPKNFTSLNALQKKIKDTAGGKGLKGPIKSLLDMSKKDMDALTESIKGVDRTTLSAVMGATSDMSFKQEGNQTLDLASQVKIAKLYEKNAAALEKNKGSGLMPNDPKKVYSHFTKTGSLAKEVLETFKKSKIPFKDLTEESKVLLKVLTEINDEKLLELAYKGGDDMSKFKKDWDVIEGYISYMKDSKFDVMNLSDKQRKEIKVSLKKLNSDLDDSTIDSLMSNAASLTNLFEGKKEQMLKEISTEKAKVKVVKEKKDIKKENNGKNSRTDRKLLNVLNRLDSAMRASATKTESQKIYLTADLNFGDEKLRVLKTKLIDAGLDSKHRDFALVE